MHHDLMEHVRSGNIKVVKYLTPLCKKIPYSVVVESIKHNNYKIFNYFIDSGFKLSKYNNRILNDCLECKDIDLSSVSTLIDYGASIDEKSLYLSFININDDVSWYLIKKSNLGDKSYIRILKTGSMSCANIVQIVSKFNDPNSINKIMIYSVLANLGLVSLYVMKSISWKNNDVNAIFKGMILTYSDEEYRHLFNKKIKDQQVADIFAKYILKNGFSDFNKAISILLEYGIDIYDMVEKES